MGLNGGEDANFPAPRAWRGRFGPRFHQPLPPVTRARHEITSGSAGTGPGIWQLLDNASPCSAVGTGDTPSMPRPGPALGVHSAP